MRSEIRKPNHFKSEQKRSDLEWFELQPAIAYGQPFEKKVRILYGRISDPHCNNAQHRIAENDIEVFFQFTAVNVGALFRATNATKNLVFGLNLSNTPTLFIQMRENFTASFATLKSKLGQFSR